MTLSVVFAMPKGELIIPGVNDKERPNAIVTCDYFACEKALHFPGEGNSADLIRHIIKTNPHGWVCERAKFFCGEHSQRADKRKLKGQLRD